MPEEEGKPNWVEKMKQGAQGVEPPKSREEINSEFMGVFQDLVSLTKAGNHKEAFEKVFAPENEKFNRSYLIPVILGQLKRDGKNAEIEELLADPRLAGKYEMSPGNVQDQLTFYRNLLDSSK